MKSIVIYYSYTGNTKKVAEVLAEYLSSISEVILIELKAKESDKFLIQAFRAFKKTKAEIEETEFNLSGYELICLGTPVWAFAPSPAMNTYLEKCLGLKNKEVVLFCTYGSGLGKERCLDYMQKILTKKGAKAFRRFFIPQTKIEDKDFILNEIKKCF